ncbi:MAG: efflux RND transporter periplasmic adaptor subunit [Deltaproteobacteria bacterium]|nr:MAG: efflux RND transporter periplasmic adaptor subunit [Deltaproteobacteria bacterium]
MMARRWFRCSQDGSTHTSVSSRFPSSGRYVFVGLCLLLGAFGCKGASSSSNRSVAVKLLKVKPKKLQTSIAVFGQTEPMAQATLGFQVSGKVMKVEADEGDPVKAGDVLALLDKESIQLNVRLSRARYYEAAASYRKLKKGYRKEVVKQYYAAYRKALANYNKAKKSYASAKKLRKSGAISEEQFDSYRSNYNSALASKNQAWQSYQMYRRGYQKEDIQSAGSKISQAKTQLDQAKKQLKDAALRAPFSGIIATKKIEVGELVNAGTPSFVLMDLKRIRIRVGIPERVIEQVRYGQNALVSLRPGKVLGVGKVERKGVVLDKATLTYPVDVVVPNPVVRKENGKPIFRFLPGKVVLVLFPRKNAKTGISVPLTAVLNDGVHKYVYIEEKGKAKRVKVTTGQTYRNEIVISSGLKAGDQMVVEGQHQLEQGTRLFVIGGPQK